jgi:hypothetical protein
MFGFGKKKSDDPKDAINDADKALNSGVSGFMAKTFMGKDFMDKANAGLDMAKQYTDYDGKKAQLMATGLPGTAEVLSIADTGALVNYNPVVQLKLKVQPQFGPEFVVDIQSAVSKIAIPRVGDKLNVKYNPANQTDLIII